MKRSGVKSLAGLVEKNYPVADILQNNPWYSLRGYSISTTTDQKTYSRLR
ncbi:MAG: hypothetical protein KDD67_15130 [Ignavibacteriae bacterium]|nr:hypothetical protein [Ignavibacteriota bacterium]MCB9217568.1 hypothetical protein [Ignavibacteria bacterium]